MRRFNELLPELDRAGVDVIGASVDEEEANREFALVNELVFELVSDTGKELADELGLLTEIGDYGERTARTTYLLDGDGTILRIWRVRPDDIDDHPDAVLEAVRAGGPSEPESK